MLWPVLMFVLSPMATTHCHRHEDADGGPSPGMTGSIDRSAQRDMVSGIGVCRVRHGSKGDRFCEMWIEIIAPCSRWRYHDLVHCCP
jgi:hypothetical protein